MKNTGDVIRKRREELKLTQTQLAEALGCSQPNIRKIEQGSTPDIRIALKIESVSE
ncbi:XRE family transcriptional regulator [Candidatus Dojkabacteria bacterium]|uniref:XRE family transcriptional regulator n=1 Tax=Candidatus Dojkabacteria bacterium TaxID=2099670 RepID=A0A5C7JD35_9BACT|nr:MAG: XRE family transcriptional regulator [Candidatus Dojkabacteria bacterium]